EPPRPREQDPLQRRVQSDPKGRRSVTQVREQTSGSAPRVEPPRGRGRMPPEGQRNFPSQRDEPPVAVLDPEERLVLARIHSRETEEGRREKKRNIVFRL